MEGLHAGDALVPEHLDVGVDLHVGSLDADAEDRRCPVAVELAAGGFVCWLKTSPPMMATGTWLRNMRLFVLAIIV